MKKVCREITASFLVVFAVLMANTVKAQNTFPTNGNVGVGTTDPDAKLTVFGDIRGTGSIGSNGTYLNVLKIPALSTSPSYFYIDTNIPATDIAAPQIQITGYMYGNSNKAMKTTLGWYYYQGNFIWSQFQSDLGYSKPSRIRIGKYTKNGSEYIRIEISNNSTYWANYTINATDMADRWPYYAGWTFNIGEMPTGTSQIVEVQQQSDVIIEGKVGIGTTTPNEKLAVNGKIRAKEIKVEASNWPDYVFEKDYKVGTLQELESYIKTNKRLPEMPSAKEVETNGLQLGEMLKLQQKKIEELTLYLIEKDKELIKNKEVVKSQNEKLQKLEEKQEKLDIILKKLIEKNN